MPARQASHHQRQLAERSRANGAKSKGPKTAAGKARTSKNALAHALTVQTPRDGADQEDRDWRITEPAIVARLAARRSRNYSTFQVW